MTRYRSRLDALERLAVTAHAHPHVVRRLDTETTTEAITRVCRAHGPAPARWRPLVVPPRLAADVWEWRAIEQQAALEAQKQTVAERFGVVSRLTTHITETTP